MVVEDDVHLVFVHITKWVSSREEFDSLGLIGFVQLGGLFFIVLFLRRGIQPLGILISLV